MAFETSITIKGMGKTFAMNPECKRYTLRDNGFEETKAGNFQLVRTLDPYGVEKKHYRLKMTVSKDLKTFKLSTTTANGLTAIDVYHLANNDVIVEKFEFILEGLVDRDVLVEI